MAALTVWRFTDARRGHDAQSRGLALALVGLHPCQCFDLPVPPPGHALLDLILGRCPGGAALPDPDLLIGAGHATHLPLLAARRARGGRTLLLMSPSLPTRCFDLCLIPDHDAPAGNTHVIRTQGPLNTIAYDGRSRSGPGLILIGGASKHFQWSETDLLRQLGAVLAADARPWLLCDSPRTPAPVRSALSRLGGANVRYMPWEQNGQDWLAERLLEAPIAWISSDSLSMIYEALSAGCTVGLFELPPRGRPRVARAIEKLIAESMVTPFALWRDGRPLQPPPRRLDEATRCATLVLDWLARSSPRGAPA